MNWLMEKLFGKQETLRVYITDQRTPEQEVMWQEQLRIRRILGYDEGNDTQNWLRLHQIMLDYETRLKALENTK